MAAIIILLPAFLAAYLAFSRSPQYAYLNVYVPVLLFLPNYYRWNPPVLPDPNFNQAVIVVIFFVWLTRNTRRWQYSITDFLVLAFALSLGYSEFINSNYKDAQALMFTMVTSVIFPYVLTKALIEPYGLREEFGKRIVITLAFVTLFSLHQSFTGDDFTLWQRALGRFFGGQGWRWEVRHRWGLVRAMGPYSHAILAGIILVIGYRIQRWLQWSQAWPKRFKQFPSFPISPANFFTIALFIGAFSTLVRAPLIGGVMAAFVVMIGFTKKRWLIVGLFSLVLFIIIPPLLSWFIDYASVGRHNAIDENQKTIAYRWDTYLAYVEIAKERFIWGWGNTGFPLLEGLRSVDNHYLLIFLRHGIVALVLLVTIIVLTSLRLFFHSMFAPVAEPRGSSLGFTLLSIYVVIGWSIATVWLGQQTLPLLFIITAWSDAYLLSKRESYRDTATPAIQKDNRPFKFQRVLS